MKNLRVNRETIYQYASLIGLLVLIVILSILSDNFFTINNFLNLFRQVSINALIAVGMTFVILTGGIDLSVGSILALGSALTGGLLLAGLNPWLAMFIGLVIGAVLGGINGFIIAKGKVAPFITTLASLSIYRGITLIYTDGIPMTGLSDSVAFELMGRGYILGIPFPVIIMLVVILMTHFILKNTVFGRHIYAVGGNEPAARLSGIKVDRIKIGVYALSGLLSVLSGIILTSRLNSAQPMAGDGFELDAIAAVVIGGTSMTGGRGKVLGTLLGAILIGVISNGLNLLNVSSFYQQIVKGAIILLAVIFDRRSE